MEAGTAVQLVMLSSPGVRPIRLDGVVRWARRIARRRRAGIGIEVTRMDGESRAQ